ncbi:MAG: Zn-ribbon domain-containing OB-fold protein [Anaerolineales bacterium]|nr:Zn-ribbon domain-containing OB-fold protein [Anaerolineales bacterium]
MTLLERDPQAPPVWLDNLPITNRYTFGLAGDRFFRALAEESKMLGTHCANCNHTYVPATSFCERCLGKLDDWVDVGTVGQVHTFTILYKDVDGSTRQSPEIIVFVRIGDGGIVHKLNGIEPDAVTIGMQVEAVFKPKAERKGNILDIAYFRPVT